MDYYRDKVELERGSNPSRDTTDWISLEFILIGESYCYLKWTIFSKHFFLGGRGFETICLRGTSWQNSPAGESLRRKDDIQGIGPDFQPTKNYFMMRLRFLRFLDYNSFRTFMMGDVTACKQLMLNTESHDYCLLYSCWN